MRRQFWEIFKDDERRTFEILGESFDDTQLTNIVAEMIHLGMPVRCETPSVDIPRKQIIQEFNTMGYQHREGLYREMLIELNRRRGR
jgi:hypothetical protein